LQPGDVKILIAVLFIICILSALTLPFSLSFVSHSSLHRYPLYHLYPTRPYISIFFIICILPVRTRVSSLLFVSYPSLHLYLLYHLYPTRPYTGILFIICILPVLTSLLSSSCLFILSVLNNSSYFIILSNLSLDLSQLDNISDPIPSEFITLNMLTVTD